MFRVITWLFLATRLVRRGHLRAQRKHVPPQPLNRSNYPTTVEDLRISWTVFLSAYAENCVCQKSFSRFLVGIIRRRRRRGVVRLAPLITYPLHVNGQHHDHELATQTTIYYRGKSRIISHLCCCPLHFSAPTPVASSSISFHRTEPSPANHGLTSLASAGGIRNFYRRQTRGGRLRRQAPQSGKTARDVGRRGMRTMARRGGGDGECFRAPVEGPCWQQLQ